MNLLKNEKSLKIISLLAILLSVFIIILFFVSNKVFPGINNNQNNKILDKSVSQSYPEIKTVSRDQGYQEIETILTNRSIESDSPTADVDNEIKRLSESGQVFWYDKNRKVSSRTPMYYLQNRLNCEKAPEERCVITGLEVYPDSVPQGYKIGECGAEGGTCLLVEPAFQKNLANSMKGIVNFYGFGKDIYMVGSLKGDDNYSIFKNDKEIFTHKMTSITEGVFEEAKIILNSPAFTFFDLKEWDENNNPVVALNIWYNGETLNEKYGVEGSSYLFSYKDKIGFIGKENGKKFFFFNGQKISQDFDEIRSYTCCSIFPYPIETDENGFLFFMAKRGEKYFFVETDLNKYLKQ